MCATTARSAVYARRQTQRRSPASRASRLPSSARGDERPSTASSARRRARPPALHVSSSGLRSCAGPRRSRAAPLRAASAPGDARLPRADAPAAGFVHRLGGVQRRAPAGLRLKPGRRRALDECAATRPDGVRSFWYGVCGPALGDAGCGRRRPRRRRQAVRIIEPKAQRPRQQATAAAKIADGEVEGPELLVVVLEAASEAWTLKGTSARQSRRVASPWHSFATPRSPRWVAPPRLLSPVRRSLRLRRRASTGPRARGRHLAVRTTFAPPSSKAGPPPRVNAAKRQSPRGRAARPTRADADAAPDAARTASEPSRRRTGAPGDERAKRAARQAEQPPRARCSPTPHDGAGELRQAASGGARWRRSRALRPRCAAERRCWRAEGGARDDDAGRARGPSSHRRADGA